MVQEMAVLGGPADLHDARRDDDRLVVPAAVVDLESSPDALESVGVAARLQAVAGYLQVLADVTAVQDHVDVGHVNLLVRQLAAFDDDCVAEVHP